ncbi:alpha-tubulin suppressor protein Aats1 [Histoplasma capsulatum H143]|uniref:Alpha-tubulin suppressor protein Aats1 n=1 Tax=Ajellomyces capsulatus (strain H143) TaxID=544712 RepID=C6HI93_AJECH|nr:alpha-tubulin suppressor protein Aats1 [Histoplasma capsulatum H143]
MPVYICNNLQKAAGSGSQMPLYAFGSNGSGQLGIGHLDDVPVPSRCLFEQENKENGPKDIDIACTSDEPVQIAAGGNHTLVLFKSGAVYTAGSNQNGRCAHDPNRITSLLHFSRVGFARGDGSCVNRFKAIFATWEASFFVDAERGHLYVCGVGNKGELGLGENYVEANSPTRIREFPPTGLEITSISSSVSHTAATLSNGEVYGWGISRKGQLGEENIKKKILWVPQKIEDVSFFACQVACGREFTAVAGDARTGEFAIFGPEKWDILSGAPKEIKYYTTLAASWHGVYVHKQDGSTISWGRNDRGQLLPPNLPRLVKLAIGSEHAVAMIEGTNIVAFGWGEHGNCGPNTDAQGNVAGRWNEIPLSAEDSNTVTGVGAGCATSWIMTA